MFTSPDSGTANWPVACGLWPVRQQRKAAHHMLNAMVNMAFKHLDMDRLGPFKRLYIRAEGGVIAQYGAHYLGALAQGQSALA
jgi:hypothetical protein